MKTILEYKDLKLSNNVSLTYYIEPNFQQYMHIIVIIEHHGRYGTYTTIKSKMVHLYASERAMIAYIRKLYKVIQQRESGLFVTNSHIIDAICYVLDVGDMWDWWYESNSDTLEKDKDKIEVLKLWINGRSKKDEMMYDALNDTTDKITHQLIDHLLNWHKINIVPKPKFSPYERY